MEKENYEFIDEVFWVQIERLDNEIEQLRKEHIIDTILNIILIILILILLFLKWWIYMSEFEFIVLFIVLYFLLKWKFEKGEDC